MFAVCERLAGFVQGYSRNRVNTEEALHVLQTAAGAAVCSGATAGSMSKHPKHLQQPLDEKLDQNKTFRKFVARKLLTQALNLLNKSNNI